MQGLLHSLPKIASDLQAISSLCQRNLRWQSKEKWQDREDLSISMLHQVFAHRTLQLFFIQQNCNSFQQLVGPGAVEIGGFING